MGFLARLCRNRLALTGALILAVIALMAVLSPVVAPPSSYRTRPAERLLPWSQTHPFGTDGFGRDVFAMVVNGSRISLWVGASVVAATSAFGTLFGLLAGMNPRLDHLLMRVLDGLMAFPSTLLAIALMAALGPQVSNVILALAIVYTPRVARVVRSQVLALREREFIEAAYAMGASRLRVVLTHVLPNCTGPLLVQASSTFSQAVLSEAALSFLGVGAPPYVPSWGNVLSEGRNYLQVAPWITFFPGLAVMLTVLGLNLLGDGLRDILDPRTRNG